MSDPYGTPGPSPRALEDAARWFLRLQDDSANAQTFQDWQHWLAAAGEHRTAYEEIEDTVLRLAKGPVTPQLPREEEMAEDAYDGSMPVAQWKQDPRAAQQAPAVGRWHRHAMAAGLAACLALGAWLWTQHAREAQLGSFPYRTAPGQQRLVRLAEGSKVTLDADSVLQVELTASRRVLTLERGEAYFEVAKDRARPFVVHAGATQVTAVGTAFNVRMSENRTVVAVTEGKVEVVAAPTLAKKAEPPAAHELAEHRAQLPRLTAQVAAGEAVSYVDDGKLPAISAVEAPLATAWLTGRRQYRDEPLRYVLQDVGRQTGRQIEIEDGAAELRFTGTLNLDNSGAWLRGLSVALPVKVIERADGTLSVTAARKQ